MDDEVVLLARIGLARDELAAVEARAAGERRVELLDLLGIASEEREEGRLRARRSLGAEEAEALARGADLSRSIRKSDAQRVARLPTVVGCAGWKCV